MTTHASPAPEPMRAVRYLDYVVLAVALPVFLVAGLPVVAWAVVGAAWVLQRLIDQALRRRALRSGDLRATMGLVTGSMILRAWLLALSIFGVGIAVSDEAGLSAAVLAIVLMSVYFTANMIVRPFERGGSTSR